MAKKKKCPGCNKLYSNNAHLINHMNSSKTGCSKFVLTCSGCNKQFASQETLTSHQTQRRNSGYHKCYDKSKIIDLSSTIQVSDLNSISDSGKKISYAVEQQIKFEKDPYHQTTVGNHITCSSTGIDYKQAFSSRSDVLNNENFTSSSQEKSGSKSIGARRNIPVWEAIKPNSIFEEHRNNIDNYSVSREQFFPHYRMCSNKRLLDDQSSILDEERTHPVISNQTLQNQTFDVGKERFFGKVHDRNMTYEALDDEDTNIYLEDNEQNETIHDEHSNNRQTIQEEDNEYDDHAFDISLDEDLLSDNEAEALRNHTLDNNQSNTTQHHTPPNREHSQYIFDRCEFNRLHRTNLIWDETDHALFELYNMHRKSRAPIGLFDSTLKWMKSHAKVLFNKSTCSLKKLPSRQVFVKQMYKKVYGKANVTKVRPRTIDISLTEFGFLPTKTTIFDFREVLIDLLSNDDIMNPQRLLFYDHDDPTKMHPPGSPIGESITSEVARRAHRRLCTQPNDVLWGCCAYNDEINFDRFGKLQLDPFSLSFLRLPVSVRNQPWAWRFFGLVHGIDSPSCETSKKMDVQTKLQVYHKVLKKIFKCFNEINLEGGIPWNLKLRNGIIKKVNLKLYLQFIIGDTKGHDAHCNRYGSHAGGLKQTVRDCDVPQELSDSIDHVCHFRNVNDMKSLNKESTNMLSFHKVDNAFYDVEFGDEIHGILGATLGEPLHILGQGLHIYHMQEFQGDMSDASWCILNTYVKHVVKQSEAQISKSHFPCVRAFRNGLTSVKLLTAKEKQARLFSIYIALLFPDCVKQLAKGRARGSWNVYGIDRLQQWFTLQEDTLILCEWLKKEVHPAKDLYSPEWYQNIVNNPNVNNTIRDNDDNMVDNNSPAQKQILDYMKKFHNLVGSRKGNGLKIPKFHLMKHFVRNIVRHGAIGNYDGSRPEGNAKELAKSPGLRTQMHHKSISLQTANRYHEDLTILECERLYHRDCSIPYQKSKIHETYTYFSEKKTSISYTNPFQLSDYDDDTRMNQDDTCFNPEMKGSQFEIYLVDRPTVMNVYTCQVKWTTSLPTTRLDDNLLYCLTNWLWVNPIGGLLTKSSKCVGFTEYRKDGFTYRCHPSYRSDNHKYDWALIKWEGFVEPVLGRILMFFDLTNCSFVEDNTETTSQSSNIVIDNHTTDVSLNTTTIPGHSENSQDYVKSHKHWVVVHSGEDSFIEEANYPSIYNFKSKIARRVKMEEKKYRVLPIESIVGPAYAFMIKNVKEDRSEVSVDNTAIVFDHPSTWAEHFLDL